MIKLQFGEDLGSLTLAQVAQRRAFLGMSGEVNTGRQDDGSGQALAIAARTMMEKTGKSEIPLNSVMGMF